MLGIPLFFDSEKQEVTISDAHGKSNNLTGGNQWRYDREKHLDEACSKPKANL
jgi:hypothetical protein